eukprot:scaffold142602_cov33-Tisochrysis_lutea.AAC.2
MYIDWNPPSKTSSLSAEAPIKVRRSSRQLSLSVDKRKTPINKTVKRAPRGNGLYLALKEHVESSCAEHDSPLKSIPVSNKFAVLASPQNVSALTEERHASSQSVPQSLGVKAAIKPLSAMPPETVSPPKKQVSFMSGDKENDLSSTPIARHTRTAAKMLQKVVTAVVDAVSPGFNKTKRSAFACFPVRSGQYLVR